MLTLEDGQYMLTTCELESGRETARLAISPFDPDDGVTSASFHREGEYLLLTIQSRIALTDAAGTELLLTAPMRCRRTSIPAPTIPTPAICVLTEKR